MEYIIFSLGIFLFILQIIPFKNNNKPKKYYGKHDYAFLIPARDESKVIENLLISITKQTYKIDPKNIYIIVEDKKDKTIKIAKKYNMNIIIRKNLDLKRKGYALDEAIKEIIKNKHYDFYFIMDADNILDKNYLLNMTKSIDEGYEIGIGYRNCKNKDNVIAVASSFTFSLINTLLNKSKMKHDDTLAVSGTGFYIKGTLIDKWKGYPFHSLTEDYELTLYLTLNGITCTYNQNAVFYDEQPTDYKSSIKQRTRWVKGYFEARRKYIPKIRNSLLKKNFGSKIKELIGINSLLLVILSMIIFIIKHFTIKNILLLLGIIYLVLFLITIIILIKENDKLNLNTKLKIHVLFYNPIFLFSFVECALKALFTKDVKWEKIEHCKNYEV